MTQQTVLIVDDDPDICDLIGGTASAMGYRGVATLKADQFLALLARDVRIVFIDLLLPETDGVEILRALENLRSEIPIVLISGAGTRILQSATNLASARGLNIVGRLDKPFGVADVEAFLRVEPVGRTAASFPGASATIFTADELSAALREEQLTLHFQPQIEIATRKVVGIETLVRWSHPSRGLVYPDFFVPLIERYGLTDELGWKIIELAVRSLPDFTVPGSPFPSISVNINAQSLLDLQFPEKVSQLLSANSVPPGNLILEITESGLIENIASTLDVLVRLRMRGVRLSVDDFGTGYSTMKQLKSIPCTEIKIDRSFVSGMSENLSDLIMVRKIIELGHELGMVVVAEGVETHEHLAMLRDDSCDIAQGFLFSRPLPGGALRSWLSHYRKL